MAASANLSGENWACGDPPNLQPLTPLPTTYLKAFGLPPQKRGFFFLGLSAGADVGLADGDRCERRAIANDLH